LRKTKSAKRNRSGRSVIKTRHNHLECDELSLLG
jgi:hypothetical protein